MINLYPTNPTSSFVVWPDSGTEIVGPETGSYTLNVTHSYDLSTRSFSVNRVNTPNNLSEMLVFNYTSGSGAPDKSGQYDFSLTEGEAREFIWGSTREKFGSTQLKFSSPNYSSGSKVVDQGRLFIYGVNDPTFDKYITANEDGRYTVYYN